MILDYPRKTMVFFLFLKNSRSKLNSMTGFEIGCFGVYSEVISVGQQGNILMNHWLNEYVL